MFSDSGDENYMVMMMVVVVVVVMMMMMMMITAHVLLTQQPNSKLQNQHKYTNIVHIHTKTHIQ
jgi:predicted metalloprotease